MVITAGDAYDLQSAKDLIDELVNWQDRDTYLEQARIKARSLLQKNWPWVSAVARALLARKTLLREEILALKD